MTERPILFSGPMVRAILDGGKTQTRRVVKPQPEGLTKGFDTFDFSVSGRDHHCPFGRPGDSLWVRETWALPPSYDAKRHGDLASQPRIGPVCFRADYPTWCPWERTRWRPSIHMPRWASRLTLEVTAVRVERLQEISEEDAKAEGAPMYVMGHGPITETDLRCDPGYWSDRLYRNGFSDLWDSIYAKRGHGWDANPWVWVVEFRKLDKRDHRP